MTFQSRLKELINERNITYSFVAKQTAIPVTTLSNYINRGSVPSITQLSLLADFFECSLDYLVGREDDLGNITTSTLSPGETLSADEKTMLNSFRNLGPFEREAILIQIQALAGAEKSLIKK